jgi:hypothetical protein
MSRQRRSPAPQRSIGRALAIGAVVVLVAGGLAAVLLQPGADRPPAAPPSVRVALPPQPTPPPPLPAAPVPPAIPSALSSVAPSAPPAAPQPIERPAWQKFAIPAPAFNGRPLIAVVIDDLGLDRRRSARAVALPGPLTLAWLPYANDVSRQAAAGRAAGHETLLHAPMQPQGSENPGPHALTLDLAPHEVRRRVAGYLALLPDAVGLNNHMGSQFTRDRRAMAPVIAEIKERGLLFLDSRTSGSSVAADAARENGVPYAVRDVFLDNELGADYVAARLAELEAAARRQRVAVGIGHPHDVTLDALERWLKDLPARGFVLAPISAIARFRIEHPELAARN